ncbi:MAG: hypothetical protein J0L94_01765 [Rhodothermia bacterium]|nr:hypothetical protein [Rhodothermia bacterium]
MLQETSHNLYHQLLAAFPAVKAYRPIDFSTPEMPPDIGHFLQKALVHRASFELEHFTSPWFRMDASGIAETFALLRKQLGEFAQFPAEDWAAALENATGIVLSYLVRPSHTLVGFVFGRQNDALAPEVVLRRMQYFAAYPYFTEILSAFLERKQGEVLAKERCLDLFSQIDRKMVEGYDVPHWLTLLKPLFEVFRFINPDGSNAVPTTLLAVFFQDKGEDGLYRRLLFEGQIRQKGVLKPDELRTFLENDPKVEEGRSVSFRSQSETGEDEVVPLAELGSERDEVVPATELGSERDEVVPVAELGSERDEVVPATELGSERDEVITPFGEISDMMPKEASQEASSDSDDFAAALALSDQLAKTFKPSAMSIPLPIAPEVVSTSDEALPRSVEEEAQPSATTETDKVTDEHSAELEDIPTHTAEEVLAAIIEAAENAPVAKGSPDQEDTVSNIQDEKPALAEDQPPQKMTTGPIRMHNLLRETLGVGKDGAASAETPHLQPPTLASTLRQPSGLPLWKQFNQKAPPEQARQATTAPNPALEAAMRLEPIILGFLSPERRTWFLRTLFNNSPSFYLELLEKLRVCKTWNEASEVIAIELFLKNNIDIYSEVAVVFTDAVETRYMQNKRSGSNG